MLTAENAAEANTIVVDVNIESYLVEEGSLLFAQMFLIFYLVLIKNIVI